MRYQFQCALPQQVIYGKALAETCPPRVRTVVRHVIVYFTVKCRWTWMWSVVSVGGSKAHASHLGVTALMCSFITFDACFNNKDNNSRLWGANGVVWYIRILLSKEHWGTSQQQGIVGSCGAYTYQMKKGPSDQEDISAPLGDKLRRQHSAFGQRRQKDVVVYPCGRDLCGEASPCRLTETKSKLSSKTRTGTN